MHHACLAIVLTVWATLATALTIEDHRFYPGSTEVTLRVLSTADLDVFEPYLLEFQRSRPALSIDY